MQLCSGAAVRSLETVHELDDLATWSRAVLGVEPYRSTVFGWLPTFRKSVLLRTFAKLAIHEHPPVPVDVEKLLAGMDRQLHRTYIERLERAGFSLDPARRQLIVFTATGLRIVDDVLDEHTTRRGAPAWWVVRGPTRAFWDAVAMIVHSRWLAAELGLLEVTEEALWRVVSSMMCEIELEESRRSPTLSDWLEAAGREGWYRWWLAHLVGRPDLAPWAFVDGIAAQAYDDVYGADKFGREPTEERLNRPVLPRIVGERAAEYVERLRALRKERFGSLEEALEAVRNALDL